MGELIDLKFHLLATKVKHNTIPRYETIKYTRFNRKISLETGIFPVHLVIEWPNTLQSTYDKGTHQQGAKRTK